MGEGAADAVANVDRDRVVAYSHADEAVGSLSPFESDIGAGELLHSEEAPVEVSALLFEDADLDLDASAANHVDTLAADLLEAVLAADDDAAEVRPDDKFGAGRRLAVVGAGFEGNVDSAGREELTIWD